MSAVTITLDLTAAQSALIKADKALSDGMEGGLTIAAEKVVHDHLRAHYVNKPNRLGAASTKYWDRVDKSVTATTTSNGTASFNTEVTLSGVGLWMKFHGGIIKPSGRISSVTGKPIRFLTIPVIAEAHGKTASEFPFLKARGKFLDGGGGVLYKPQEGSDFGTVYFILTRQAKIKPDPNILPPASAIADEMSAAIKASLE
jgi:hypothetical protein